MKTLPFVKKPSLGTIGSAVVLSSILLTACAVAPVAPPGAAEARAELNALQSNPDMVRHARVELRDAEEAVRLAEQPLDEDKTELAEHRVYMADRMVAIAAAKAATRKAEAAREQLSEEREEARLASRTREVDQARAEARRARQAAEEATEMSARETEELQQQIEELQAKTTDRGLVLTLGDVLFASGSAELQSGDNRNLEKLVTFLNEYPERDVLIEGHTDNVGSAAFNQTLSRQRAESVRRYLTERGIQSRRIDVSGVGLARPVASNETATGRQQNRRVEVIIEH